MNLMNSGLYTLKKSQKTWRSAAVAAVASACALSMTACAADAAAPGAAAEAPGTIPATAAAASPVGDASRAALACKATSNCVNSFDTSGLAPLRFAGTSAQAMQALRATLAAFPQATILQADALSMEVVFTTFLGFRDAVDFRVDAQAQRIDYRSRSLLGKYDFGKNRSRMTEFSARFHERAAH